MQTNIYNFINNTNKILSDFLKEKVNIFDKTQSKFLFNFTDNGTEELKKRIELILKNRTPYYITEEFPQDTFKDFQKGDIWASKSYTQYWLFHDFERYGNIFSIFDQNAYLETQYQYKLKKEYNQKEALLGIILINNPKNIRLLDIKEHFNVDY